MNWPETADFTEVRAGSLEENIRAARLGAGCLRFSEASFTGDALPHIPDVEWIRGLRIAFGRPFDFYEIERWHQLEYLYVDAKLGAKPLDLAGLNQLRWLWSPKGKRVTLPAPGTPLLTLQTDGYTTSSKTLKEFAVWPTLERLVVKSGGLETVEGVGRMPALRELKLETCGRLLSISAAGEAPALEQLTIIKCRDLTTLRGLERSARLRHVQLDGMSISDIEVLAKIPTLERAGFYSVQGAARARELLPQVQHLYLDLCHTTPHATPKVDMTNRFIAYLPTAKWRDRMERDLNSFYTHEALATADELLMQFMAQMDHARGDQTKLRAGVQAVVTAFNEINTQHPNFVETMETEELVDFITEVAEAAGYESEDGDITWEWRG
jgi:hypothetical protein